MMGWRRLWKYDAWRQFPRKLPQNQKKKYLASQALASCLLLGAPATSVCMTTLGDCLSVSRLSVTPLIRLTPPCAGRPCGVPRGH